MQNSDAWIEVNAAGLAHNLAAVRALLKPGVRFMAVVKANAYGHGAAAARTLADLGVDMLGVTHLAEAREIRREGVRTPILVFSPLLGSQASEAIELNIVGTVSGLDQAQDLSAAALQLGRPLPVHLKIDTGMARLGALYPESVNFIWRTLELAGLKTEGIYTHFASASNPDLKDARQQMDRFYSVLADAEKPELRHVLSHCANSAAVLQLPESQADMVRVGTLLYGQFPASYLSNRLALKPTWKMLARISQIKDVPAGWKVGYGAEQTLTRASTLAVIPVGYADGFGIETAARSAATPAARLRSALKAVMNPPARFVLVNGLRAPVVGRISMQMTTIDLTDIPNPRQCSVVEVPCRRVTSNPLLPRILISGDPDDRAS